MNFELEASDVSSPTTDAVRACLAHGQSCVVVGHAGTGKTHAVRKAVNGAPWVQLRDDDLQFDGFFTDLASQLHAGKPIVDALSSGDVQAVLDASNAALNGTTLVIDRAERLHFEDSWGWDEPIEGLWRPAQVRLTQWINELLGHRPVVVVARGRAGLFADRQRIRHTSPTQWPLKLKRSTRGFRDWAALGNALHGQPAGLTIGTLLLELTTKDEFNAIVQSFGADEEDLDAVPPPEVLRNLLVELRNRLPEDWRRVLATVRALDGAPAAIVEHVLPEDRSTLEYLESLGAIERCRERLSLMSALTLDEPLAELAPVERRNVLGAAAKECLERVPDVARPDAESAEFVLRAHALYVELGDFESARRTARFHVGGLIRLARRQSLERNYAEARRMYGVIEPLAAQQNRLRSYVLHYETMNGLWAGELTRDVVVDGLRGSRELWPENALWWQREAEILLTMGRGRDALELIARAYQSVPGHPRRDLFLRVRPAEHAMTDAVGGFVDALRIIAPLDGQSLAEDSEARKRVDAIYDRWRDGVELGELGEGAQYHLAFFAPVPVSVSYLDKNDVRAESQALQRIARAPSALQALDKLANVVADDLRTLIQTASHTLSDADVHRKGVLLSFVDPLNSDIGLVHRDTRWLLGRIQDDRFVPVQSGLTPVKLGPEANTPVATTNTLYFAQFPVHRDGVPCGPPHLWKLAGSGRSLSDLQERFRELSSSHE